MAHVVNDGLVAFVRLTEGGPVKLLEGDTVPPSADAVRVAELTRAGVLSSVALSDKVEDILAEVGDDKAKAAAALEQERAGKNRKTLVEALEAIVGDQS